MPTTTARLLDLLSLLQARRDWPGAVLADRLGVSHRTVRRDVERLREMGYRVQAAMGPDGGYRLEAGSELPPLLFDDEQVIALTIALQAATVTGAGIEEGALKALAAVRQVLPSRLRHRLQAVEFTTAARTGDAPAPAVASEVLVAVSDAVRAREVLRFDQADAGTPVTGPAPPRRVEPHHLVAASGRWYLVAWDLDGDEWRIFRADRITPRTPTGPRFSPREVPGGDASEYMSARFKGSSAANAWPCTGSVVLHLPAGDVVPFAGDGAVEALGPDRCRYTAGSWSWVALAAALGRFDAEMDEVDPPELARAFTRLSARYERAAH
ncbi:MULTISPECIES: helix-turn-helix transcriptional regulator [Microbacterium]|uniref:WYL domain-containing transcriptional regulator n=1 Tax=Microbacterium wangchenii TaxID=2541726 RepID=A0ABX5SXE1_9MICO|nr:MULTISPECIES: WYL domain-containing protein [Microbacterium]MCK6067592.1 WYL domain-containing protein [Microbacterium sp. EYE_512]QBR89484.1 WYL domain-containing transcriptional regulator [Microbacterium wangchenii]TXK16918.1 WYL domain-containing protein [Microbacterium wangchenii]